MRRLMVLAASIAVVLVGVGAASPLPQTQAAMPGSWMVRGACTPIWADAPSPRVGLATGELYAVAAPSTTDAWAAGGFLEMNDDYEWVAVAPPLIEHWNGTRWSVVLTPRVDGVLWDIAATSPKDAWAVGQEGSAEADRLLLHWDGKSWSRMALPVVVRDLNAISALAADDIWGVGTVWRGDTPVAEIVHWNGARWTRAASLSNIAAISARDVWAVGEAKSRPFAAHWNGVRWQAFVLKRDGDADESWLSTVAGLKGNDVWLGGGAHQSELSPGNVFSNLFHWNGTRLMAAKHPSPGATELVGIAPVSASELWAVSTNYYWDSNEYLWHRTKGKWRTTQLAGDRALVDVAVVPQARAGDPLLWAVGHTGGDDAPSMPLIRRYSCSD